MREWSLGPGDPLELVISADFRLCVPDYSNDHTWELVTTGGDPPALALRTTYGLRARSMRLFPRFTLAGQTVSDPTGFFFRPRLRRFHPNFLMLEFSPFQDIDVRAEYWVPGSQTCAGRFSFTNKTDAPTSFQLELCVQLIPFEGGRPMALLPMQSANVLAGQTANLAPAVFLTGGPQPGGGPYPSLAVDRTLEPGETRTLVWAQAALGEAKESMELARLTAAQPWEPLRARIDLLNAAQSVEVTTGEADWDAALALSQKTALRLFFGPGGSVPHPSFVTSRQPDQGFSPCGDGSDYPPSWRGQTPLDSYYLAGLLPGARLAEGLLRNFLATRTPEGWVSWKVGRTGSPGGWLATPLLASLAWQVYQHDPDAGFLQEVQPALEAFAECWLGLDHDRDGDGFPEWDHLLQSGFEDNPVFSVWQSGGQGAHISAAESPDLAAMLCREFHSLADIAAALEQPGQAERWNGKAQALRLLVDSCWNARRGIYLRRDRDSHASPKGKALRKLRGPGGTLTLDLAFKEPVRLLVRMELAGPATRKPRLTLRGHYGKARQTETFERGDFQWGTRLAAATSLKLYTSLEAVRLEGMEKRDRVSIMIADYSSEDVTQFLPLWAGMAEPEQADAIVHQSLFAPDRFGDPFGVPACPRAIFSTARNVSLETQAEMDRICRAIHLPWNSLVVAGLLGAGLRVEAAQLFRRLMGAVIQNLKKRHAFAAAYHSITGEGMGERNSLQGLAPLGLFLDILGVRIESPRRVVLSGKNPYPWPVTVKYRGLTLTRQADRTVVVFPNGQSLSLDDPTDAVVSID